MFKILKFIWVIAGLCFLTYLFYNYQAQGFDDDLVRKASSQVKFDQGDKYIRYQSNPESTVEIIFLPGGMVQHTAYEPLARSIAEKGFNVTIAEMPWRMADFGYQDIVDLKPFHNLDRKMIIMGHSKGAKMAAQFVYENPEKSDGLILLGTTHPRDINLSDLSIPILKILASEDGIASVADSKKNNKNLPINTRYETIRGGNHSQFGYYGNQLGDGSATISREEQVKQITTLVNDFLRNNLPANDSTTIL